MAEGRQGPMTIYGGQNVRQSFSYGIGLGSRERNFSGGCTVLYS